MKVKKKKQKSFYILGYHKCRLHKGSLCTGEGLEKGFIFRSLCNFRHPGEVYRPECRAVENW